MHTCDPRQGRTVAQLSGLNACIICAGCCSMQCNSAEGLHFSAFHSSCNCRETGSLCLSILCFLFMYINSIFVCASTCIYYKYSVHITLQK